MRRLFAGLLILLAAGALFLLVPQIRSQPPENRPDRLPGGRPGQPRGERGGPRGGFDPPPPPLLAALDKDQDGEISADELNSAAAALKTLDKNKDGQIADAELRPDFGPGGFPFPGGPGGRRGGPRGFDPFGGEGEMTERVPPEKLSFNDGVATIPDHATFQKLSYKGEEVMIDTFLSGLEFVKFTLDKPGSDEQQLYFINTNTHRAHPMFARIAGLPRGRGDNQMKGVLVYRPLLKSHSGKPGLFTFEFEPFDAYAFNMVKMCQELLVEKMPTLQGRVGYYPRGNGALAQCEADRDLYAAGDVVIYRDEDLLATDLAYLPLNPGRSFGRLRMMEIEQRPSPRDVVLYTSLPNEMPRVAGIITSVRQTPLSHVNLRAVQDKIPNAFIADAAESDAIKPLIGKFVAYHVTADGYSIREATRQEVETHFAGLRPAEEQTPRRDLSVTQIRPLDKITFEDSASVGVKAANLATLRTFGFPAGTVPDGFAVPFHFYDDFMKHNGFYDYIAVLLKNPEFQRDRDVQVEQLAKLRSLIKKGKMPSAMTAALDALHKSFPVGASIRCRSSTNNEDLPGFSGAGLYDSFTHRADEGHLAKSIQQVYASLWNFRAFEEREFYRVDHFATAMGVLVHPNFKGELANGVAVTDDILYQSEGSYYLNTQIGEDLVTNPTGESIPEEVLLDWWERDRDQLMRTSNRVAPGKQLLSAEQVDRLRKYLGTIHARFARLYGVSLDDDRFAMEIEFKIAKDGRLVIKQARPWVYAPADVTAIAQRSQDRPGPPADSVPGGPQPGFQPGSFPPGPPGGFPGPPGGFPGPPGFHLMEALDVDRDGKISTAEIDHAVAAFKTLDKNKDGKLSAEEIGWPPVGGFGGRRGGFPGPGGPGRPPGAQRPQRPGVEADAARPAGQRPPAGGSRSNRFFSVAQLKTLDRNDDGKITRDEIPKRLQDLILDRVDTNSDEVIDLNELSRLGQPPDNNQGKRQP